VLEMGFYVEGEIAQLCRWAQPHIGVVTNIGPIHLERAGSMEAIFRGKSELVQALPADGYAVLNWDDDWVRQMAPLTRAAIFRYGLGPEADLWADEIHSEGLEGIRFRFHRRLPTGKEEVLHVHLPLLGRHAVHTALRAAAVGLIAGLAWEDIIAGLRDVNAQVRIEIVPGPRGSTLIDDTYNASPPSTIAALNLLADLQGRRIAVLGDMLELGSYAETGHRLVGGRAAAVVDELVTVGTLARWIADEAARLGLPAARIHPVADADAAFAVLQELIAPGDFVLIKGSRALGLEHLVQRLSLFVTGN
ncbi:MAG: UDP-N-acetylmuramoyl-tripeptide--D-alanyl-D-alanine ligase, partial [Caldilineales bacterium]|nr:UDP-N-acetylmuramoyl-tripeptide--D-alanyl-D-alanine ligase [Caldilineales bacterium]